MQAADVPLDDKIKHNALLVPERRALFLGGEASWPSPHWHRCLLLPKVPAWGQSVSIAEGVCGSLIRPCHPPPNTLPVVLTLRLVITDLSHIWLPTSLSPPGGGDRVCSQAWGAWQT